MKLITVFMLYNICFVIMIYWTRMLYCMQCTVH